MLFNIEHFDEKIKASALCEEEGEEEGYFQHPLALTLAWSFCLTWLRYEYCIYAQIEASPTLAMNVSFYKRKI